MKKIIFVFSLLCFYQISQTQTFSSKMCKFQKNFLERLLNTYYDESLKMIVQDLTDNEIKEWSQPTYDTLVIPIYLNTVIHEKLHGFNDRLSSETYAYFINSLCTLYVSHIDGLPQSSFLKNYIPKEIADSIYRYLIYIEGKPDIITPEFKKVLKNNEIYSVSHGIYGLLEEFNAYYTNCYFSYTIAPYFLKFSSEDLTSIDYINHYYSEICPFYEFSYFIGSYLHFLEIHYSDKYNLLIQDTALRKAFTMIYDNFQKTVSEMENYYIKNFEPMKIGYSNDNELLLFLSLKKEDKEKDLAILKDVISKKYENDDYAYITDKMIKRAYSLVKRKVNKNMKKYNITFEKCKILVFQSMGVRYKKFLERLISSPHIQSALQRFRWESSCK